ncbi:protocadherin Fat 2 isoform X2 [Engraulis encrasicolus]|uniref:protocadherin Fat 2 isoform X2 n=1 Tax=Engraulis encrasicolus TaxID=184585 RepID=UPI002FD4C976
MPKMRPFQRRLLLCLTVLVLLVAATCEGEVLMIPRAKDSTPLRFTHHLYNATIPENSAPKTYVQSSTRMGIVVADAFWDVRYNLVAGDDDELFAVEEVNVGDFCFLRVKTRSGHSTVLNREVRDVYTITVEAVESTHNFQAWTKVSIQVLDTNDLKPLFYPASYNVAIKEDTPLKTSIAKVSATDADLGINAEFYYSFDSRAHPFAVDPFTGVITLVKNLNSSRRDRYELKVLAEDRTKKISGVQKYANNARVIVTITKDTTDSLPLLSSFSVKGAMLDSDKIHVDIQVKPQPLQIETLSIVSGDPEQCFQVTPSNVQGSDFQILSTKRINWFQNPFGLNLTLQAKDGSSPPLLSPKQEIHIPPPPVSPLKFEQDVYYTTLSEFAPIKSHVVRVTATPMLPNITYRLKSIDGSNKFHMNPKTGVIVTSETVDFEKRSRYDLVVTLNQGEAEARVIVDVTDENDNAPIFTLPSYQVSLSENVPIGTSVLAVTAIDVDQDNNGFVTYAIANTAPVPFTIDAFSGVVVTTEELDYEVMKRWYHLRIWASDSGSPFSHVSEAVVTITMSNVNDNTPLFEMANCNASIPPDFAVGSAIGQGLSAVDLDELLQVKYAIAFGNDEELFAINPTSGVITLAKPINTDPEEGQALTYTLKIIATDGKYSSDPTKVTINVNSTVKEAVMHCQETGVVKQLTDKLIESIKPVLSVQDEESYSDVHIINRHSPKFAVGTPGTIDVKEDTPINTTVLHIKAHDEDTGFNGKLIYAITNGNENGCFAMDIFSGEICLICSLDRESKEFYILNITAYDLGTPQNSVWKFLAVNVLDVNDSPPRFQQPRYVVSISENAELQTSVFQAQAVDLDLTDNGIIRYSLLTQTELFRVDEETGEVSVAGRLDREVTPRHDLRIEARDQAKTDPQLFSVLDLVVVLEDVNDNPPRFAPKIHRIKVPEDVPVGTVLLWVEVFDLDLGSGRLINYNLKNNENGIFLLDTSTGSLTLEKELDYERKQMYNLTVRAVDHGQPRSLSSSCFIEVEVQDVNENLNSPAFSEFVYTAQVAEDSAVGTSVLTVTAVDHDAGRDGVVRYFIQDGSGLGVFTVDEETGVIRTLETLDRETTTHYWLTIFATDLGTVPLVSWTEVYLEVLDINDNPPQFSQPIYFASIQENQPPEQSVVQVSATDMDMSSENKLTYQMLDSQRTYFSIDPTTGVISTLAELDREQKAEHIIEVSVSDNGIPPLRSTASVVIRVEDENDNGPVFSHKIFQVRLPERHGNHTPQDVYRMVARDNDEGLNGMITYSLQDDQEGRFELHPVTGTVTSMGNFSSGQYTILTIKASDHGSPARTATARLDIEWLPTPNPSPEPLAFDEAHFTFAVMETDPVSHMVGIISTEITSNLLWFDITGGDEDLDFDIDKNSGSIVVARPLDAGKRSNYNLTVRVTDGLQAITTQAYIRVLDMNEHRPVFQKSLYEVRVPEDTAPWKEILQVSAEDADINSRLVYSIHGSVHPDSAASFQLDPRSGVLVLAEQLDFEALPLHVLIIMVRDQEIPVKRNFVRALIHVEDCNDHTPTFLSSRYETSVANLAPTGTEVLRVKALDKDTGSNAEIVYAFHSGNGDGAFDIDQDTGSIRVAKPLSTPGQDQYHLTVKAMDQGFPERSDLCPVTVHVTLSDMTPPRFLSEEYFTEISEAVRPGAPVVTVIAESPAPLQYAIKDGDPNRTFHINANSGQISVESELDYETCASYRLRVQATTSMGISSSVIVHVYVVDENDNPPVFLHRSFHGQISEAAHVGAMVIGENNSPLVIKASDADKDSNALLVFQILEPQAQKVFKVDPNMGTISLIAPVDYESTPEFHLTVQVRDSGEPSLMAETPAMVVIRVLDFNDCPPIFTESSYNTSMELPLFKDTEVVQVLAHDPDSEVTYSLSESSPNKHFIIHPSSGVISVANTSAIQGQHQLSVVASDGLYKDEAVVHVNISNMMLSSLKFEEGHKVATVLENVTFVKTLAVLRAVGGFLKEPLHYKVLNGGDKFTIIESSGVLHTTGVPFDREEQDEYDLVVEVKDTRWPPRRALTNIKVYIDDINDNAPVFQNLPHSLTISEETEPGDVLYQVMASDADVGENGSVIFMLQDDFEFFRIDPYLGDVSLQRPLDFESLNKYALTVLASDEGEPSYTAVAELYVQVQNRSHPVFQSSFYPLKLPENIAPYTTILHVQARNPDGYRIIYNLEEENATKNFYIDFKTGALSVTDALDHETQTSHLLTVRATDSVMGTFAEAKVEIEVEDVNDNAPVFQNHTYEAHVLEGLPAGTSVLQISATDEDSGKNKEVTYELLSTDKNETDFFEIDPQTGLLVTSQELDFESTQHLLLKIKATDSGSPPLSSEAYILVNVTDVNDNPPDFTKTHYQASLDEQATCGHIVVKIQASDPDSTNLQYKILSGNENRYFAINESSGVISFSNVCKRNLDPFYNLTVAVSDGVFQKTAAVNIDMIHSNRHSPYFSQNIYEAELAENTEPGTRVIRLAAIDPDDGPYGSVDYTIINKLADETFSIDQDGQIVTSKPLDRENPLQRVIAIKVMAKDGGGRVAFCTVKVILTDENDNAPQFKASEYQVSIQSTVNKGAPVIQIMAYDADEGKNADVTYTIQEASEVTEDVIEINPFTGVVSVKESLADMEDKIFHFKVKARDGGLPFYNSTVPVEVKVVPPEAPLPQFTEPLYTFTASEDLPLGTEIGVVRADGDDPIIYSLVEGNTIESNKEHVFAVDEESGTLVVQKTIDHERTKWYQIDVVAQGNHNGTDVASLVSVSIQVQDVNDNEPTFDADPYQAFLAENLPPGTTVIQVTANDPDTGDNGQVTYLLEPEDVGDIFAIDSESGWITTMREMDCESVQMYRFYVVGTDHGSKVKLSSSALVEVMITDENDNPPRFTEELYQGSVMENARPGEVIVTLSTTDLDVTAENRLVTCYITDGDPLGLFSVEPDGEEWSVVLRGPLDRELNDRHTLQVVASDGRAQDTTSVEIHVLDINDNSPLCEQLLYTEAVMENSPPGRFILKVSAADPDISTNGHLSFTLHGHNADKFHLNQWTGELFTLATLDRERESDYELVVKVTDGGGRSCQADIVLMVQDMNDNVPQFSMDHYEVTVFDNTTVRTPVAVIYARDPDTGINSEVRYSLHGLDSSFFSLDEISGVLRLERPLTEQAQPTFELKVKATDRGLPHHMHSFATVTVNVVDLSQYQPVFASSEYSTSVPESIAVGTEVLSVTAHMTDEETAGEPVTYTIVAGNEGAKFQINPHTGILWVSDSLDFETSREYYLSVEGTRGRSSLSDVTMVIINVTDVNDNAPVFGRADYATEVSEDITPGHLVMQVTADDLDGPLNSMVRYFIANGDPQHQFTIDPHSGEIRATALLDREEVPHYSLTVLASDDGEPPLSAAVQVTVTVADVNDNPPTFSQVNHSFTLQEGEPVGTSVVQLLVTDKDTPKNGPPFTFHVVSGNEDRRFHIDQGGLLSLAAPLRKKSKAQHLLKVQVTDSGHPPLSSICVVLINVTEQSKFPPVVSPLEVFITVPTGTPFASSVIGKLHATDQDLHDVLTFTRVSESPAGARFSVGARDGRVVADEDLEPGVYNLNVSVSDGTSSTMAPVRVHVWAAWQRALERGFSLSLAGLSPEEFLGDHWRGLQRSLSTSLGVPRHELHIASLQQEPNSLVLDVLLLWRAPVDSELVGGDGGAAAGLATQRLVGAVANAEEALGLSVLRLHHDGCLEPGCPPRGCRGAVVMEEERVNHYATARMGFITPRHHWESVCSCNGSAIKFDGNGYLKYLYQVSEHVRHFQLSFRIKTVQRDSVIMTTNASDWGILKLEDGELQFRYACGNQLPGAVQVRGHQVADGRWHRVLLVVNGTLLSLSVDGDVHSSRSQGVSPSSSGVTLTEPCRLVRPRGALLLATAGRLEQERAERQRLRRHDPPQGLRGCLEGLQFNGEAIRTAEARLSGAEGRRVFGVYQCCAAEAPGGGCAAVSQPCMNGGSCLEAEGGEISCSCPGHFYGSRCELAGNPCESQPCVHGGQCVPKPDGFFCNCTEDSDGSRCQNLVDPCSPNPCGRGFDCKRAEQSFYCNALPVVSPITYLEMVEIVGGVLGLLLLVAAFVYLRKRYVNHKKHKPICVQDSNGYFPAHLTKSMMMVDTAPMEMTTLMGSRSDLDRHSPFRTLKPHHGPPPHGPGGPQHGGSLLLSPKPQGPMVCSVAPHLPEPAPPPSTSDNESIAKTNWEPDYEVYPADPDYYGRPAVREFPQFDIVESTYNTSTCDSRRSDSRRSDSRRNSRFGGFPFPLERVGGGGGDRRAPLPPCYSNQNLDDFLGPDGLPLPSHQCPNEYTAISYYPAQHAQSLDNVSGSNYQRLSVVGTRLSVAHPSYTTSREPSPARSRRAAPQPQAPRHPARHSGRQSYASSDMVESDYGSCEEVMF